MTQKYIIAWEKWQNPWQKEDDDDTNDNWEHADYDLAEEDTPKEEGKLLLTPMGAIPLSNHNSPNKIFNLWIGYTNFPLSHKVVKILSKKIPGVESLDIYTPYRMRVGIGKLFKPKEVMNNIDVILQSHLTKKDKQRDANG